MLREPLVHVVVLGAMLFVVHRAVAPPRASEEITVSAATLDGMKQDFQRRTGRAPSASDEQALLDDFVDEEVLVREALAMGLDRGDPIVRRRLLQKMEFLIDNTEPVPAPTDAQLAAFLAAHADRYASPARISFTHVFVSTQAHPTDAAAVAAGLKTQLEAGADPTPLGDPFLRGRDVRLYAQAELANVYGAGFAADVMRAPENVWTGPLRSTFGFHVVRVGERRAGTAPELGAVRERVEHDWREDERQRLDREARSRLRARYVVRVEGRS
jgi:hypothetical protein